MKNLVGVSGQQVEHLAMIFIVVFVPSMGRNEYRYRKPM
jgi:hypothetical protein